MEAKQYDFTEAEQEMNKWYKPQELSAMLKDSTLKLLNDEEDWAVKLRELSLAVLSVCNVLDRIKVVN